MNEQLKKALDSFVSNIESRKQSEKLLVLGMLLAGLVLSYLSLAFDPMRININRLSSQITNTERAIQVQITTYEGMVVQSQEDPNRFANERLAIVDREQAFLTAEIQSLAGDLVTPNQMTEILTTVLERQAGLELVSFQNTAPQPLRELGTSTDDLTDSEFDSEFEANLQSNISGQVYSHGLTIEFEGDFFSTLKYLRFLEEITGSFFWDAVSFKQNTWPNAEVTLRIHTLSTNQGFIGV